MKNYKAEIFNKLMGKMVIGQMPIEYVEQISEEMCVLIREIVKEACNDKELCDYCSPKILSNIEKLIGGEK